MTESTPLSIETIVEILKAYVSKRQALPSERATTELCKASGQSVEAIKNFYTKEFEVAGGEGDPWATPRPGYHPY